MAATQQGRRLTEAHRLGQVRIGQAMVRQMFDLWALLDPADLDGSFDRWLRAVIPAVARGRQASAGLAANYYRAFRTAETGVLTQFQPVLVSAVPVQAVTASMTVTGPVAMRSALGSGQLFDRAVETAKASSAGSAMRHVLNAGRDTVVRSTAADDRAFGWARATSGSPCGFCAMLASRGPVYDQRTVTFQSHDSCSCSAEPAYQRDRSSWPAGSAELRDLWDSEVSGLPPDEALNAFRRLLAHDH
jgi:hypothetical protein